MTGHEAALRRELGFYEARGDKDRAGQVQAELDRLAAPPVPPEPVSVTDDPSKAADDPDADGAAVVKPKAKARRSRS